MNKDWSEKFNEVKSNNCELINDSLIDGSSIDSYLLDSSVRKVIENREQNRIEKSKDLPSVTRIAKKEDVVQIANIYKRSFAEHILVHRGILTDTNYLLDRLNVDSEVWVVNEQRGIIKGVAALGLTSIVGLGEIERVCVDEKYRGNGVALSLCSYLLNEAKQRDIGFVEAFARGNMPSMQQTFLNLGFDVYGVSPRFEIIHEDRVVREMFVHMGKILKPETLYLTGLDLIAPAKKFV
ncbi:MAG: GNAT family N-acetyltransferase [Candidatus Woesearchaeota archaeon]|jgi:N-acetylglutamate synthase-like GNAT family acetyltransferase